MVTARSRSGTEVKEEVKMTGWKVIKNETDRGVQTRWGEKERKY